MLKIHEIKVGKKHKISDKVEDKPQEFEADIEDPDQPPSKRSTILNLSDDEEDIERGKRSGRQSSPKLIERERDEETAIASPPRRKQRPKPKRYTTPQGNNELLLAPQDNDEPLIEKPIDPQDIAIQQRRLISAFDRPDLAPLNYEESLFQDYAAEYNLVDQATDEGTKLMST